MSRGISTLITRPLNCIMRVLHIRLGHVNLFLLLSEVQFGTIKQSDKLVSIFKPQFFFTILKHWHQHVFFFDFKHNKKG